MKTKKDISIIVPVFEEQDSIKQLYLEIKENVNNKYDWEIIFVNDGSKDNSKKIISYLTCIFSSTGTILSKKGVIGYLFKWSLKCFMQSKQGNILLKDIKKSYICFLSVSVGLLG